MVKKISTLALATILAIPVAASAGAGSISNAELDTKIEKLTREFQKQISDLRAQVGEQKATITTFEEKSDKWDLASRFQWSGDMRNRVDFHTADTVAFYSANNVARGIYDVLDASNGMGIMLGSFGMNPAVATITQLQTGLGTFYPTPAAFIAAPTLPYNATTNPLGIAGGPAANTGLTPKRMTDLAAIFYNPTVGTMLGGMGASTISTLFPYFANPQALAGFMKNIDPANRAAIFASMYGASGAGYLPTPAATYDNDTLYTTRLRLNLRAKATEDVEVKARIVGYKAWGSQDSPTPETDLNGIHDTDN
ncbi:MAG: DUF3373 family protein, partial [Desulfurivibrionaceae bacterium]